MIRAMGHLTIDYIMSSLKLLSVTVPVGVGGCKTEEAKVVNKQLGFILVLQFRSCENSLVQNDYSF